MSWTTNLLVIANRTVDSEALLRVLRDRGAGGSIAMTLVAPSDGGRVPTARRLDRAVDRLEAEGIAVTGVLGHPDPLVAVEEVWDERRFDEIIVATPPADVSRWTALDLPHRIERLTGAHVTHVVVEAGAMPRRRTPRAYA